MCGITGMVYHQDGERASQDVLQRMCRSLIHRGPDDEGYFVNRTVGLGMRRLQIIDLSTGHQPISNEDGRYWIVFNGEIFNYQELRDDLERKGHRFQTSTDTETIIHAYEEYGLDCASKLNGMFAFAIWDKELKQLVIARDRLGVKPLYYYMDERCLVFGSELKALLACPEVPRSVNFEALDVFLTFEYVPSPMSMFQGIKKLPPGHFLILRHGVIDIKQYWSIDYATENSEHPEQDLYELLKDAVRLRMISDVPLGAFLSGGVDSSAVVCMMSELVEQPIKTFSIGFDDPSYNELSYARQVANHFKTDHHELTIQPDIVGLVEGLIHYLDEPLADVSVFPTYLVSKLAREHVTVVLSGDGGDELFAGYDWYVADRVDQYYRKLPKFLRQSLMPGLLDLLPPSSQKKGLVNKAKRFVSGAVQGEHLHHYRWTMYANQEMKQNLYDSSMWGRIPNRNAESRFVPYLNQYPQAPRIWRQQYADIHSFMVDDILVKVDRMSMANSLEARTPFLDYRMVEFAMRLPSNLNLQGLQTKALLKRSLRGKVPDEILYRKKEGFSIPMKHWLREELKPMLGDVLSADRMKREGYFNSAYIDTLKDEHWRGTANHAHELWSLMMFEIWKDKIFDSSPAHAPEHAHVAHS